MECNFLDVVELRLKERLADVIKPLINNGCNTLEHYKYITGIKVGLEEAITITKKVYKDLYEAKDVDSSNLNVSGKQQQGVSHESKRKRREFY